MSAEARYQRVILKLSGESFCPPGEGGISMDEVVHIAREIKDCAGPGMRDRRRDWRR